jgi:hypothetical protein
MTIRMEYLYQMFPAEMKLEELRLFQRLSTTIGVPVANLEGTAPHSVQD